MTQPPPGGYPPPGNNPPGGQPPAGQPPTPPPGAPPAGPPSGGVPQGPPPGGYPPPPPGGTPPPPPGGQGYPPQGQPPPGQGYPPPGAGAPPPPPGGQGYPPQGQPPPGQGYPPPGQGYPPQGQQGYPPQGPPGYPPQGQPSAGASFDFSKLSIGDWGLLGSGVLYFIFSFFTWEWHFSGGSTSTIFGNIPGGYGTWHSGWTTWYIIPTLLIVAVLVAKGLKTFAPKVNLSAVKPEFMAYGAAAASALMLIAVIVMLATSGPMYFAAWACFIFALGVGYFAVVDAQKAGAKLPFKLPVPDNF